MKLTVAEALQGDVGNNIARLPTSVMQELDIEAGDIIEITGDSTAVASVRRAYPDDTDVIRIDGTTRFNADTSIGETVTVKQKDCQPAQSITIAPVEKVRFSGDPTRYFHSQLINTPLIERQKLTINVMGTNLNYVVTNIKPKGCVKVTRDTTLNITEQPVSEESLKIPEVSYEDIGGLDDEIENIREMVEIPMKHPEVFERLGIGAPKGVLLTGPPGTGKTLLAKAVASETDSSFFTIAGPEIMSKYYGESEKQLREVFEQAKENAPSIIFIDEIDSIAPKRGEGNDQTEQRVVSQLLTLLDGLESRGDVVVMAASNRPDAIDEALRRPGRFDREISINPPDEPGRKEILQIHTRGMPLEDVDFDNLAQRTIGYTGADIEALCKEAALKALKPHMPDLQEFTTDVPNEVLEDLTVSMEHFNAALPGVEPSAMREVLIQRPHVTWEDIGGLEDAKQQLQEAVELPLQRPELFKQAGITTPKGVLLHGPPGTGKTLLAKAIANEANANFIAVKGPELVSKWVGESEKRVREIFKRAKQVSPTVIFFDEFDSITKVRGDNLTDSTERMVNQLLTEIDGVEELEQVTVIAATNRPDLIDPALLRAGRIELKIAVDVPDADARREIFNVHTDDMPLADDVEMESLINDTDGWTGADIMSVCREAGLDAIRDTVADEGDSVTVTQENFNNALATVRESQDDWSSTSGDQTERVEEAIGEASA